MPVTGPSDHTLRSAELASTGQDAAAGFANILAHLLKQALAQRAPLTERVLPSMAAN